MNDAQITKIEDRDFINGFIEKAGGYGELNKQVKKELRRWLEKTAQGRLQLVEQKHGRSTPHALRFGLARLLYALGKYDESQQLFEFESQLHLVASLHAQMSSAAMRRLSSTVKVSHGELYQIFQ